MDGELSAASDTLLARFGRALEVVLDEPQRELDKCNVFVKYLPNDVDDDVLHALFAGFGDIASCKVMVDLDSGKSLGYGFVRFVLPDAAATAVDAMSGHRISNKRLLCKLSHYNPPKDKPAVAQDAVVLSPLIGSVDAGALKALLCRFGTIIHAKVIGKKKGNPRRGVVQFTGPDAASGAVKALDGKSVAGFSASNLTVALAEASLVPGTKAASGGGALSRTSRKCKDAAILVRQFYAHTIRLVRDGALHTPLAPVSDYVSPGTPDPDPKSLAGIASFPELDGFDAVAPLALPLSGVLMVVAPLHPHMDAAVLYAMLAPFGLLAASTIAPLTPDAAAAVNLTPDVGSSNARMAVAVFHAPAAAAAATVALHGYRQGRTILSAAVPDVQTATSLAAGTIAALRHRRRRPHQR
ncbi:uncharacterized protein AMSG_02604 [Thecamonas trahens ATCC 50062]|uniref:RRM domain-containing protein n=1 Tax=Thecamonas trahens ATCC 50062 TaxID=461836 RepID=A0A0L0D8H4_THETB|nr:hypothetical protein AMSG_02604 [Thecamonas trahens ATCC 50062]KNC47578.1 hypothetical protein AMSG_02604 [Thecamonas trahens ATCC 50062]|eukprot:XP_013759510.1 hypothetical protein AMSG_02604 [Thecamonas trahens ATCC 50062]